MASRRRSTASPPPPPPPASWTEIWREVQIAGAVAGAITLVLLARRWTQLALGTGRLNQEFFAGNLAIGTLVAAVEARLEGGPRAQRPTAARPPGAGVSGGSQNDGET